MSKVYASGKVFHFPGKLGDMLAGRLTAPIHVRLKPTNRCTHRCWYCCYRNPDLFLSERMNERDEIPRAKMQEIVGDLAAMGVRAVTFSGGGEPLCYPHILEAVRGLLDGGVKVAMLTHGGLLEGEAAELLAGGATWVRVSMDAADRETYARLRGVRPEEFDRVCGNVARFAATAGRRCVLGINLIVTRETSGGVLAFLRMAKALGADHVKVSGAVVSTKAAENAAYLGPFFAEVKSQIAEAVAALAGKTFGIVDKFHLPGGTEESFEPTYARCPFAQCLTVIAADQNVYTCQDKAYTTSGLLGSIRGCSFREFWSSDAVRRRLVELNPSVECRHHCVANGKTLTLLDYLEADQDHVDFV